jgi:glycosyltransferase involved in cell wall biosynthesis
LQVLIYEPDHSGHHFAYLSLLLPALADLAGKVVLATTRVAVESAQFRMLVQPHAGRMTVDASVKATAGITLGAAMERAAALREAVRRIRPDHLLVPYGDGIGQAMVLSRWLGRGSLPKGLTGDILFLRGGIAYPAESLKRRLATRAAWMLAQRVPFTRLHHLDPLVHDWLRTRCGPKAAARWSIMPDPVERPPPMDRVQARRRMGLPEDGRAIGCAGIMDRRKGVDLLIRAFAAAGLGSADRLYLLGPHDPDIRAMLEGDHADLVRAGRIISRDRFIPPEDLAASLSAMDLVCTPYPRHIGSASIVIRAAAAGRPVLGCSFGWIAAMVPRFGLGWTCDVENIAEFGAAIRQRLDESDAWRPGPALERFVEFHSPDNFVRCWTAQIRSLLGVEETGRAITWESVRQGAAAGEPPAPAAR